MAAWTAHDQYATLTALGLVGSSPSNESGWTRSLCFSDKWVLGVDKQRRIAKRIATVCAQLHVFVAFNDPSSDILPCSGQLPLGRGVTSTDVPWYGEPIANNDKMNRVNSNITSG